MPVLHLLAGPNGSGKSTFFEHILGPATGLPFINADLIAAQRWPGAEEERAYEAARIAAEQRGALLDEGRSFATETVFSHPSKIELVERARAVGYAVTLHVVMVPEELAAVRARLRADQGGHSVPERKLRQRYQRLWSLLASAIEIADCTIIYDNSSARRPFSVVARFRRGQPLGEPVWPSWTPAPLSGR